MTNKVETKFQDDFLTEFRKVGGHAASTVGSVYISGQPDLTLTSVHGNTMRTELKVYRSLELPTVDTIVALLHGPQRNVILHQLWKRNAYCPIIAQIANVPAKVCIVYKQKISFDFWTNVAIVLAHSKPCSRPYCE